MSSYSKNWSTTSEQERQTGPGLTSVPGPPWLPKASKQATIHSPPAVWNQSTLPTSAMWAPLAPDAKQWWIDNGQCAFCAASRYTFKQCPEGNQRDPPPFLLWELSPASDSSKKRLPRRASPPLIPRPCHPLQPWETSTTGDTSWTYYGFLHWFFLTCIFISGISVCNLLLKKELNGNHLVITCTPSYNSELIHNEALVDTSRLGFAFIDESFACQ